MATGSSDRYDLVFTKSGTSYNYMCQQKGATKEFVVQDAPLTPQTLITSSASPTVLQPEREIQISQVDWRKGFQDEMLDDESGYALTKADAKLYAKKHGLVFIEGNDVLKRWEKEKAGRV